MSDATNAISAARFAYNPTPLGAAGLVLGAALPGKSGGVQFKPGYENGQYTVNGNPWEPAKKYQIDGATGQFDLMPTIGATNNQYMKQFRDASADISGGTRMPSAERMMYQNMRNSLLSDPQALAQFDATYHPRQIPQLPGQSGLNPQQLRMVQKFDARLNPDNAYRGMFNPQNAMNPFANTLTGAKDAVGGDISLLGGYARSINNPTFRPK